MVSEMLPVPKAAKHYPQQPDRVVKLATTSRQADGCQQGHLPLLRPKV